MKRIYLDHASITPLDPRVAVVMQPWLDGAWNPSALHAEGRAARGAVDAARRSLAELWALKPRDIVFTASGSESVALALLGVAGAMAPGTLWTSRAEHAAVLRCADALANRGWDIRWLPVDENARPDLAELDAQLRSGAPGPRLVSLMLVNNELGTLNPVVETADIAHSHGALFHCDAIAAGESVELGPVINAADLVSLAAQKCGGPLGVGILIRKQPVPLVALVSGGTQEFGLRAGTENVPAIAGAAEAFCLRDAERASNAAQARELQEQFETRILREFPDGIRIAARGAPRSPSISHLAVAGLDGPSLLAACDLAGLAVSAGSACEAGALERSHVAEAIGLEARWSGLLRFSWGNVTPADDVDEAVHRLAEIVRRMREVQAYER